MSKELEDLRGLIDECEGCDMSATARRLRPILARLEAAERVCESIADRVDAALELDALEGSSSWSPARWDRANQRAGEIEAALAERLAAYRDLDAPKQEKA